MSSTATIIVIALTASIFIQQQVEAQTPEKISYQAVIRNSSNQLVTNNNIGMQISILQGSATGTAVYVERQYPSTNANGLVSIEIGGGTIVSGTFALIDWASGTYFIKTETDLNGGANYTISGTSQILSVPYALHAKTAENGFSGDYNDLGNKPDFTGWDNNASDDFNGSYNDLTDKPDLFSGNYNDLTNQPIIPTINDASISTTLLWSSTKTNTELGNKANVIDVYTKTNLQTSGQAIVHYDNLSHKPTNIDEDKTDDVNLTGNQTIAGNKTFTGTISASNKVITKVATPVNTDDAVNKAYVIELLSNLGLVPNNFEGFVSDNDGNIYKTIKIGNQVWMAENLKYLPSVVGPGTDSKTTPYHYVYGYDGTNVADAKATFNYTTYGVLYNWPAAMAGSASSAANPSGVQGVCPTGWHLPSDAEWTELTDYLGGTSVVGGKLKEIGTTHWTSPNTGATNETGFTALPGGLRDENGAFYLIGNYGCWWSATEVNPSYAWFLYIYFSSSYVTRSYHYKESGFSVRCVRD